MKEEDNDAEANHPEALARARKRLAQSAIFDRAPKARKEREKRVRSAVDGRSLRATGRTRQFNFMAKPDVHAAAVQLAAGEAITLAELMELLIEKAVKEGV